jgi:hypothetical protein
MSAHRLVTMIYSSSILANCCRQGIARGGGSATRTNDLDTPTSDGEKWRPTNGHVPIQAQPHPATSTADRRHRDRPLRYDYCPKHGSQDTTRNPLPILRRTDRGPPGQRRQLALSALPRLH